MRNTFSLQQNEAVLVAFRISKLRELKVAIYATSDFTTIVKSSQKLKSFSHELRNSGSMFKWRVFADKKLKEQTGNKNESELIIQAAVLGRS
ncbi:hypothetical protein P5673_020049 [Acropora cervicornis]|uniref:Uncharacterized protein n=1 Tax=Acropora cervicornis TaxID=6130 RepID=A0AAD9V1J2_ACRCE|nr:hypothetical protein P5673_020049 [Acropora cervicornis]